MLYRIFVKTNALGILAVCMQKFEWKKRSHSANLEGHEKNICITVLKTKNYPQESPPGVPSSFSARYNKNYEVGIIRWPDNDNLSQIRSRFCEYFISHKTLKLVSTPDYNKNLNILEAFKDRCISIDFTGLQAKKLQEFLIKYIYYVPVYMSRIEKQNHYNKCFGIFSFKTALKTPKTPGLQNLSSEPSDAGMKIILKAEAIAFILKDVLESPYQNIKVYTKTDEDLNKSKTIFLIHIKSKSKKIEFQISYNELIPIESYLKVYNDSFEEPIIKLHLQNLSMWQTNIGTSFSELINESFCEEEHRNTIIVRSRAWAQFLPYLIENTLLIGRVKEYLNLIRYLGCNIQEINNDQEFSDYINAKEFINGNGQHISGVNIRAGIETNEKKIILWEKNTASSVL